MYEYAATCKRVVDGDTCDLVVDCGFRHTITDRFRLARINTPERGEPGWAKATAMLEQLIAGKDLVIRTQKPKDKWGRWVAEIFVDGKCVNDQLVAEGFADPYED